MSHFKNTHKGKYTLQNPSKYKGSINDVFYRSRWELIIMKKLDSHPDVLEWSSEEIIIKYLSPIDGKVHRYFPDFFMKKRGPDGLVESILIEVKPAAQTVPPKVSNKPTKRYINEVTTWGVNSSKWEYAREYCRKLGWKFIIITEKELGLKF